MHEEESTVLVDVRTQRDVRRGSLEAIRATRSSTFFFVPHGMLEMKKILLSVFSVEDEKGCFLSP